MTDPSFLRASDLSRLKEILAEGACGSIVGLSNVGKSALLRAVAEPETGPNAPLNVYVDCNLMLALTDQAFYEVTLRSVLGVAKHLTVKVPAKAIAEVEKLYRQVIEAVQPGAIIASLSFNEGIALLCEQLQRRVVLLFDEFDDPFGTLDGRVFLNLRALHDKYECLTYVAATGMSLRDRRQDSEAGEFCELFIGHQITLGALSQEDSSRAVSAWAKDDGAMLEPDEVKFVVEHAGGHPGLLRAATQLLVQVASGAPIHSRAQALNLVHDKMESDLAVRDECAKLWSQLSPIEQDALVGLTLDEEEALPAAAQAELIVKGILLPGKPPRIFGELFAAFARRQRHMRQPAQAGIRVDVDAGEVWLDGERVPTLTDLEYRLLLLVYGRMGKICDKYQIVEAVWGQDYIDEVDDARIEKLISRLRSKIEHDPANPRHLLTVRGRGYKLAAV